MSKKTVIHLDTTGYTKDENGVWEKDRFRTSPCGTWDDDSKVTFTQIYADITCLKCHHSLRDYYGKRDAIRSLIGRRGARQLSIPGEFTLRRLVEMQAQQILGKVTEARWKIESTMNQLDSLNKDLSYVDMEKAHDTTCLGSLLASLTYYEERITPSADTTQAQEDTHDHE